MLNKNRIIFKEPLHTLAIIIFSLLGGILIFTGENFLLGIIFVFITLYYVAQGIPRSMTYFNTIKKLIRNG